MAGTGLRSRRIALSTAFLLLAANSTACGSSEENEEEQAVFYCVDGQDVIVDESNCDNDVSGLYYLAYGAAIPLGLLIGTRLAGIRRFPANDAAARAAWGLPTTGRITNGTVRTGIIGSGGNTGTSGS